MTSIVRFIRDENGATAIEAALVLPVFLLLIFSMLEIGFIAVSMTTIEAATAVTARQARLGIDGGTGDIISYIRQEIQARAGGLLNPQNIVITTDTQAYGTLPQPEPCYENPAPAAGTCPNGPFLDLNGNGSYDNGAANQPTLNLGSSGDLIKIHVYYPWQILSPIVEPVLATQSSGSGSAFLIRATTLVHNE